jgi:hypothetical protein
LRFEGLHVPVILLVCVTMPSLSSSANPPTFFPTLLAVSPTFLAMPPLNLRAMRGDRRSIQVQRGRKSRRKTLECIQHRVRQSYFTSCLCVRHYFTRPSKAFVSPDVASLTALLLVFVMSSPILTRIGNQSEDDSNTSMVRAGR